MIRSVGFNQKVKKLLQECEQETAMTDQCFQALLRLYGELPEESKGGGKQ